MSCTATAIEAMNPSPAEQKKRIVTRGYNVNTQVLSKSAPSTAAITRLMGRECVSFFALDADDGEYVWKRSNYITVAIAVPALVKVAGTGETKWSFLVATFLATFLEWGYRCPVRMTLLNCNFDIQVWNHNPFRLLTWLDERWQLQLINADRNRWVFLIK